MNAYELPAEPLDFSALQQIVDLGDGDPSLLQEMITIFREDTPARLAVLRKALESADATAFGAEAHAIKGAAGTMGAQRMRVLAFAMEQAGRNGALGADERAALDMIESAYAEALEAMESFALRQSPP